jgi:hypothetical protein
MDPLHAVVVIITINIIREVSRQYGRGFGSSHPKGK